MNERTATQSGTFEIGLVMAGAISAGAYTAGVISFLLEALDAWYREKDNGNPSVPQHNVNIRVISGTSAGGMTAGILAMSLFRDFQMVRNPSVAGPTGNPLFEAWVNLAEIEGFLGKNDRYENQLVSILDSSLLDAIADKVFRMDLPYLERPYIDPELHLILCMTNLRGIPYTLPFIDDVSLGHQMTMHADFLHFLLTGRPSPNHPDDEFCYRLNPSNSADDEWDRLRRGCLASGAFPLGLAPRKMAVAIEKYNDPLRMIPSSTRSARHRGKHHEKPDVSNPSPIQPSWWPPLSGHPNKYSFWASDGGLINNEPFELAHRILARGDTHLERHAGKADRMVIMIDPFAGWSIDAFQDDTATRPSFIATAVKILGALRSQARFKADELALALDPKVNSRFMIAPKRSLNNQIVISDRAIASGSLGGFGGFLDRPFRVHDYLLGRRNCQKFLKDRLVLEVTKSEFSPGFGSSYPEADARKWIRQSPDGNRPVIPIIPLVGDMDKDPGRPDWPELSPDRFDCISERIRPRLDFVAGRLLDPVRFYYRIPLKLAWWLCLRRSSRRKILAHIRDDLISRHLWKTIK
ncbi:patatin-like phospholipase family protein [bacterium]|nr:patatin-like phospholipase family protein [candidate division CSSED10-310 bacterium]